ncbi:uncharacterized protein LOC131240489 isoform X2 [Magnolia sinica]|uniref:uncharacterized protein LOC131240489 isoform X2 n=1 Tax=Magnolia sinica TaxID=86752 RepID=UPI002658DBE1|nr:uncharacterized protein LOC131240489 isoform X2 [Magnolia sinica]
MPHEIPMISLRAGKWTMPSDSDDLSYLAGESESMVELPLCKTCSRFRGMDLSAEYFVHALGLQELEEAEIEMDLLQKDQALHEVSGSSKEEAHWTPDSPLLSSNTWWPYPVSIFFWTVGSWHSESVNREGEILMA